MVQRTIRFRILPDGRVEEQVEGVQGAACEALTERIEARLGTVRQRQSTAEAFATQPLAAPLQERLQQPLRQPSDP